MSNKSKVITVVVILIVIIGGIVFGVNVSKKSKENVNFDKMETTSSSEGKTAEINEDNDEEIPKMELTREGSLEATTILLRALNKSPQEGLTLKDRLDEVSKENFDKNKVFTEEGWNLLNLSDFMKTDPRGEVLIAQSMLSILNVIEESGNKDITPASVPLEGVIYFDKEMKISFIPVDLFTNAPTKLSFEMVYVDGEWLLQPYTIISQIAIRTTEQGLINKTPEGKKVLSDEASKGETVSDKKDDDEKKEETSKDIESKDDKKDESSKEESKDDKKAEETKSSSNEDKK